MKLTDRILRYGAAAIVLGITGAVVSQSARADQQTSPDLSVPGYAPMQYSASVDRTTPSGGSPDDVLQASLKARPANSMIAGATLAPNNYQFGGSSAPLLEIDVVASAKYLTPAQRMKVFWEASLFQGALAEGLATGADTSTGIAGGDVAVHLLDGTVARIGLGAGQVVTGQRFSRGDDRSRATAVANISKVVQSFGLSVVSVDMITYRDDAVAVTVQVPPNGSFARFDELRQAITGSPANFEGVYLELQDDSGATIALSATAFRTGGGSQWTDPGYAGAIGGVPHGIERRPSDTTNEPLPIAHSGAKWSLETPSAAN
jgi:hypothetical protein